MVISPSRTSPNATQNSRQLPPFFFTFSAACLKGFSPPAFPCPSIPSSDLPLPASPSELEFAPRRRASFLSWLLLGVMARDSSCRSVSAAARWSSGEQASLAVISLRRCGGTKPLGRGVGGISWALLVMLWVGASWVGGLGVEGWDMSEVQRIVCRRAQNPGRADGVSMSWWFGGDTSVTRVWVTLP